jgi:hypothetical protein
LILLNHLGHCIQVRFTDHVTAASNVSPGVTGGQDKAFLRLTELRRISASFSVFAQVFS